MGLFSFFRRRHRLRKERKERQRKEKEDRLRQKQHRAQAASSGTSATLIASPITLTSPSPQPQLKNLDPAPPLPAVEIRASSPDAAVSISVSSESEETETATQNTTPTPSVKQLSAGPVQKVRSIRKALPYDPMSNIFTPISTDAPVAQIQASQTHPIPLPAFYQQDGPVETNNFYGNMLVEKQNLPVWTHPYSVWKCDDDQFKGLGISHTAANQRVFGDDPNANPCKYFFSPVGICSMLVGAREFQDKSYSFKVGECERFSFGYRFELDGGGSMKGKLVQGMGFVSVVYEGSITPRLASKVGIQSLDKKGDVNGLHKYVASLFDQTKWVIYSSSDSWKLENANSAVANTQGSGSTLVQVAKVPLNGDENAYDQASGAYVTDMTLTATVEGSRATYRFNFQKQGNSPSGKVVQFFLPHQYRKADGSNDSGKLGAELDSTCKGVMHAYLTDSFVINEDLAPDELQFDPYKEGSGCRGYKQSCLDKIKQVCSQEIDSFDVINFSNTDSMYTSGKILDKGAFLLYVAGFVVKDEGLAKKQLDKMKQAFARFIDNKQQAPLVYNSTWKGIVSSAGLEDGNFYCDYGNCFYNDHHFHYGYHIHAAALTVMADKKYGDGQFLNRCKTWVETLLRDVCNPSADDKYFPVFRSFDFFGGHSFANGLFAHGDGKDEESSSEDYHCYYGVKLWGQVTGNDNLKKVGSLILGIERTAMNMYMLYRNDNDVIPANFKANKVSGILFENKIDHATYFGLNKEYIHGIHMIPVTPVSNFIRNTQFVKEEWDQMQLGDLSNQIDSGWKGLLKLNQAIIDPQAAWDFFAADGFDDKWLDNGMSRSWSLAYCAGMMQ